MRAALTYPEGWGHRKVDRAIGILRNIGERRRQAEEEARRLPEALDLADELDF